VKGTFPHGTIVRVLIASILETVLQVCNTYVKNWQLHWREGYLILTRYVGSYSDLYCTEASSHQTSLCTSIGSFLATTTFFFIQTRHIQIFINVWLINNQNLPSFIKKLVYEVANYFTGVEEVFISMLKNILRVQKTLQQAGITAVSVFYTKL